MAEEMRLVPLEPTNEMFAAFRDADYNSPTGFRQAYAAMLRAAPSQPEGQQPGELRQIHVGAPYVEPAYTVSDDMLVGPLYAGLTMQDIRLHMGEGPLKAEDVLKAVNIIIGKRVAATTTPEGQQSVDVGERERIARVIDPWAFSVVGNIMHTERASADREKALAKADSILTGAEHG